MQGDQGKQEQLIGVQLWPFCTPLQVYLLIVLWSVCSVRLYSVAVPWVGAQVTKKTVFALSWRVALGSLIAISTWQRICPASSHSLLYCFLSRWPLTRYAHHHWSICPDYLTLKAHYGLLLAAVCSVNCWRARSQIGGCIHATRLCKVSFRWHRCTWCRVFRALFTWPSFYLFFPFCISFYLSFLACKG